MALTGVVSLGLVVAADGRSVAAAALGRKDGADKQFDEAKLHLRQALGACASPPHAARCATEVEAARKTGDGADGGALCGLVSSARRTRWAARAQLWRSGAGVVADGGQPARIAAGIGAKTPWRHARIAARSERQSGLGRVHFPRQNASDLACERGASGSASPWQTRMRALTAPGAAGRPGSRRPAEAGGERDVRPIARQIRARPARPCSNRTPKPQNPRIIIKVIK